MRKLFQSRGNRPRISGIGRSTGKNRTRGVKGAATEETPRRLSTSGGRWWLIAGRVAEDRLNSARGVNDMYQKIGERRGRAGGRHNGEAAPAGTMQRRAEIEDRWRASSSTAGVGARARFRK